MEEALAGLPEKIEELQSELASGPVIGSGDWYISQYLIWFLVACVVVVAIVLLAKRNLHVTPNNTFTSMVEYGVDFVRKDMGEGIIGHGFEKHVPLLCTVFFVILLNNLIGLVPGCKPGTGTISITFTISLVVFLHFNVYGMRVQGVGNYIKNLAPEGVMFPLNILVWCIELVSLMLRLVTLAIRLFANMYAGHIVLGTFAALIGLFFNAAIAQASIITGLPIVAWLVLLVAMYAMEFLVAFIQAYVFTLLSAVYISLAKGH